MENHPGRNRKWNSENYVLKSLNKIKPQSPKKNEVDTYGTPVFPPD